ncbi:hypothetical protein BDN67DRAFT_1014615 [Paxillus ammoniavirescens]|nr:hypothetical protein BDN67DRAFT_1014615 [Paxillus ammoniavirescens]
MKVIDRTSIKEEDDKDSPKSPPEPPPPPLHHHPAPSPLPPPSPSHPKQQNDADDVRMCKTPARQCADPLHNPGGQTDAPDSVPPSIRLEGEKNRLMRLNVEPTDVKMNDVNVEDNHDHQLPENPVGMTDGVEHHPNGPTEPPDKEQGEQGRVSELRDTLTVEDVGTDKSSQVNKTEGDEGDEGMKVEKTKSKEDNVDTTKLNKTPARRHADALHGPGGETTTSDSTPPSVWLKGESSKQASRLVETNDEEDEDNHRPSRSPVGMMDGDKCHPNKPTEPPDKEEGAQGENGKLRIKSRVEPVQLRESSQVDEPEDEGVERETRSKEVKVELGGKVEDDGGHRDGRMNDMGDQMSSASCNSQQVETSALAEDKVGRQDELLGEAATDEDDELPANKHNEWDASRAGTFFSWALGRPTMSLSSSRAPSTQRKQLFKDIQSHLPNPCPPSQVSQLLLDMPIRWSSTYVMIDRAEKKKKFVDIFVCELGLQADMMAKCKKINELMLTEEEWKRVKLFASLLAHSDNAQQSFSSDKGCTL